MKKITIKSITLRNWRGEKERTTMFHTDRPTTISGGNGVGKSRHLDAFTWLLFGKDSLDRKDYELRTRDERGNILHRCECSVEAEIVIDGTPHKIKREFKEKWQKPRGQEQEVFKGNVTECTWDDVPLQVSEYNRKVNDEIIDSDLFKILTSPRYFTEKMPWQQKREILLEMAGPRSDEEIAGNDADFQQLLKELSGKSLAEFRKQLAAEKKRLKAELSEVQPRIDQTHKMMPEADNWDGIVAEIKDTESVIGSLDNQMVDANKRAEAKQEKVSEIWKKIEDVRNAQREVVAAEHRRRLKEADDMNAERKSIERKLKSAHEEMTELRIDLARSKERSDTCTKEAQSLKGQLDSLRQEWYDINAGVYTGTGVCPHCGQKLPEAMIADERAGFIKHMAGKLLENNERGKSLSAQYKSYVKELAELTAKRDKCEALITSKEQEIAMMNEALEEHPVAQVKPVVNEELPEWMSLQGQIDALNAEIAKIGTRVQGDDIEAIRQRRNEKMELITSLKERLSKKAQIERAEGEIERLEGRGRELAQRIADVERSEYVAQKFTRAKISDCEARINRMFTRVSFLLFDQTQDGNEYEVCVPMVDGVPYGVANTASQVNAGLDIINILCRYNNVAAPLFIDGAESVNEYIETPAQTIFLRVTEEEKLTVN